MAVKYFGANRVLAVALIGWSAVTIGTGFIHNYHQAIAVRMLLGAFEAGVAPGISFIFSTIYNRDGFAKRIALVNFANATSGYATRLFSSSFHLLTLFQRRRRAFRLRYPDHGSEARPRSVEMALHHRGGCVDRHLRLLLVFIPPHARNGMVLE